MRIFATRLSVATLLATALFGFAACSGDDDNNDTTTADAGAGANDASNVTLSDSQIADVLHTVNQGEITEAKTAESTSTSSAVVSLATEFDTMHTVADATLTAFASDAGLALTDSSIVDMLMATTASDEQMYASLTAAEFDATYVQNQITVHSNVLSIITNQLLPVVQNAELKTLTQQAHDMVAMHLAEAQALQADGGVESTDDAGVTDDAGLDAAASDAANAADAADSGG